MKKEKEKSYLRRFLPYYKPYKGIFARDLACATVVAAVELVFPMLVRMLLNSSTETEVHASLQFIWLTGAAILLMRVLDVFCNYYIESRGHIMGAYMETDMRMKLFDKLMSLSFSYYDKTEVGQIMSRITTDLFDITEFAHHCPEEFYLAGLKITGAFLILCTVSVPLTLIIFAILPFMCLFAFVYNKKMRRAAKLRREKIGNINANVEDCLSGVRVVKSFANENVEREKFDRTSDEFLSAKKTELSLFRRVSQRYPFLRCFHVSRRCRLRCNVHNSRKDRSRRPCRLRTLYLSFADCDQPHRSVHRAIPAGDDRL